MIDLFNHIDKLPAIVQEVIARYALDTEDSADYRTCQDLLDEISVHGYTFDYGLDAIPCNLRKLI
jgi:hypothetical protein